LLVADLHFEKMASFARRGQLLPPYDTGLTLSRLEADIARMGAQRLVSLGDSFHRVDSAELLLPEDRARLDAIAQSVECFWLSGNHDPEPHGIGGVCLSELEMDGLLFTHHPSKGRPGMIAGHLHPAARVAMAGRSRADLSCAAKTPCRRLAAEEQTAEPAAKERKQHTGYAVE
jgi:DNA ligase-associated metallophosphoesterase